MIDVASGRQAGAGERERERKQKETKVLFSPPYPSHASSFSENPPIHEENFSSAIFTVPSSI